MEDILKVIVAIVIVCSLSFLLTAGLVYVAILLLNWCGLALVWSWKISFVVWILCFIIKMLLGGVKND
jgi:hypothetical protein